MCYASLTTQWDKEVQNKCKRNRLSSYVYHGAINTKKISESRLSKYDIVITTYNTVLQEYNVHTDIERPYEMSKLFQVFILILI